MVLPLALGLGIGCSERGPTAALEAPPDAKESVTLAGSPLPATLEFQGVERLLAGEQDVLVSWSPVREGGEVRHDLRYRVYADAGSEDPSLMPCALVTEPGVTECRLEGLAPGVTIHVLVRVQDAQGREDRNTALLRATPNPVRYVVAGRAPGGDGLTPQSAYGSILEATEEMLGRPGLNLYLGGGPFRERLLLFEGMALYGGFGPDFRPESRGAADAVTAWEPVGEGDLIVVAPGKRWCVLDGLDLGGDGRAGRGIVADDCRLQLDHLRVHDFRRMGLHVRGEEDSYSMARVRLHACDVYANGAEGLSLHGVTDVQVQRSSIRHNGQEGIEAKPLAAGTGRLARLELRASRIAHNGDAGIDVNVGLLEGSVAPLGPIHIDVHDCEITANQGTGINVDLQVTAADGLDLSIVLRRNQVTDSGGHGVQLDADAPGHLALHENHITGSGGTGLRLSGDDASAVILLQDNVLRDNRGGDLEQVGAARAREQSATPVPTNSNDEAADAAKPATRETSA